MRGSLEGLLLLVMELTLLQGRGEGDERGRGWEGEGMRGRGDGRLARRPPAAGHGTYAPTRERGRDEGERGWEKGMRG